jgi:SAM-dependent methyltransferase
MRQAAQESYGYLKNVRFVEGTSEATHFPDNTFDLVSARHTLHHHPNIAKTLVELHRVLKPGGRLVIVDEITPSEAVNDWYHRLEIIRDPTHIRAYFLREWQSFITSAGLTWIVGDDQTRYPIDTETWILRQNPSPEQAETVRQLLREASEVAKKTFAILYQNGTALSFEMPMAVILALK